MKPSHNTIPTATILTIHDSPRNSSNTHLTTEPHVTIPTHQSPRHQTVKHSTFIGSPVKPGSAPENKQQVLGSVVAKELKTGGHFFHIIDEMRGVRKTSESRLQHTRDEITRIDNDPPEKLEWKKMVQTGQYIRIRRQDLEKEKKDKDNKEAVWVSGRVLSKEREFKAFRNKVIDFKYDLKHKKDVIKYLTSREPLKPEVLAQPLYSSIDTKPQTAQAVKRESIRMISTARTPPTNFDEVKEELANLHFNVVESPAQQQKDFLLIYNQEQLKKLKGGITYMNKWKVKHKPKNTTTSYRSDGLMDLDDKQEMDEETDKSPRSPQSPKSPIRNANPGSPMLSENDFFKKKSLSRKQTIEDRALNLDPHKEFLRKIGLPSHPVSRKSSKLGLFLTSVDAGLFKETMENKLEALFGRDITTSIASPKINQLDTDGPQSPNGFFFPSRSKNVSPVGTNHNDPSYSDMLRTSNDNNNIFSRKEGNKFSESPRIPQKRMSLGNTSWSPRKQNWTLKESPDAKMMFSSKSKMKAEAEKNALLKRYTQISMNCSENVKATVDLKSSLNKEFGLLRGQLIKIGEVKTQDNEIETRIKQDMYAEIQNQYTIAANAGNAGKNKHIRKSASESRNKKEKW